MIQAFFLSIKSLAGQTMWYGVSTVLGRFINLLTTPIIGILASAINGQQGSLYAAIAFLNIVFTFGMETTFFRFARDEKPSTIFNIATSTIITIGIPLAIVLISLRDSISDLLSVPEAPHLIILAVTIILLDALASMPFAKLRLEGRPKKFAFIKIVNVILNVLFIFIFIIAIPWIQKNNLANDLFANYELEKNALTYILSSNIIASAITLLLLIPEFKNFKFRLHKTLWKKMLVYTIPLVIVGLGGMINDVSDRIMLPRLLSGSQEVRETLAGIYNLNFKLAALIIIFIQAFRMGAEPFFIKQSTDKDAPATYARIMTLFVIMCCIGILSVLLFRDIWEYYIQVNLHEERRAGFIIVPYLLLSKVLYGIYYNLSIWFKLENKTHIGAIITLIGAAITLILNYTLIPKFGYIACAWASLACYGFMVTASYLIGRRYYPVPYDILKIVVYLAVAYGIYFIHSSFINSVPDILILKVGIGITFIILFVVFAIFYDRKEFSALPVIGKYLK